jgi:hypothetical protein
MRLGVAKTARESAKSPEEFPQKRQAIDYAETRACFRSGEIRVLDSAGNIERTIMFNEENRRL